MVSNLLTSRARLMIWTWKPQIWTVYSSPFQYSFRPPVCIQGRGCYIFSLPNLTPEPRLVQSLPGAQGCLYWLTAPCIISQDIRFSQACCSALSQNVRVEVSGPRGLFPGITPCSPLPRHLLWWPQEGRDSGSLSAVTLIQTHFSQGWGGKRVHLESANWQALGDSQNFVLMARRHHAP